MLPESIINRPKQPFALPITAMLNKKHVLFQILNDTLTSQTFINRGIFNSNKIKKLISKQINNPSNQVADALWSIMVLELWLKNTESIMQL